MALKSINPVNNSLIQSFEAHSPKQVEVKLAQAQQAFENWRLTSFEERARLMLKCAEILEQEIDQYAPIMTLEMGKPLKEARSEIKKCAQTCRYYAEHAALFLKSEPAPTEALESYIQFDPLGVVLAIMPWNFPFWQVLRFAAPTLMAGNTAVLKHASNVSLCALAIEDIFRKAGFPDGAFQTLLLPSSEVEKLIADDRIKAVTLTGSENAGSKVAEAAGRHIKKTVLELGGSDAFIVLADANLAMAAETAVKSRMINTGQSCIAAKRFIVVHEVAEEFTRLMLQHLQKLKGGDPMQPETDYGPMAREDLAEELLKQVQKSLEMGARVLTGANRPESAGAYFNPTILTDVKPGMPAFDEELFGPVACVIVAKDEDEALALANRHRYGLGAALWTQNLEKAKELTGRIEAGAVFVNALVKSDPRVPFGGIKKSGYGRELSYLGIREFVNQKTVWIEQASGSEVTHNAVNAVTE